MRFLLGLAIALALTSACAAKALNFDVPAAAVVPPPPDGRQAAPVSLSRMAANLPDGQVFAAITNNLCAAGFDELRWRSSMNQFSDPDFDRIFREEFAKAGLKVSGDATNLFEQDQKSADLQLGALITDFKATICGYWVSKGNAAIEVDWQIYSASAGKVLARIPVRAGVSDVKGPNTEILLPKLLLDSFAESVRHLAANPEFRRIVFGPPQLGAAPTSAQAPLRAAFVEAAKPVPLKEAATGAVMIFAGAGAGSGVLISPDGYILTNHHVTGDSGRVRIRWADGAEMVGVVVRSDRRRDVALIKVATPRGRPLAVRRTAVELGETVFAVGTPLDPSLQNTVTKGIVSAVRMVEGQPFIQSDTPVTHGNSGGPLLDKDGAVVGLTDLGLDPAAGSTINFFIPIGDALKALALQPAA